GALVFLQPAYGEAASDATARDGLESRVGFEARLTRRVLLLADMGFGSSGSESASTYRAEVFYNLLAGKDRPFHLAVGSGYRREDQGVSVWLGRLVAERVHDSSRLLGDLRFERAFDPGRDEIDAILTLAAARTLGHGTSAGFEVLGEDLEALWTPNEAEGGARLLVGPSVHWVRSDRRLLATLAGGPVFRFNANEQTSAAPRDLGNGYVIRASLACVF
ncbi:MAG TPA: hypothetical protein VIC28_11550, partial [Thermoanaerobaculia bacterium]